MNTYVLLVDWDRKWNGSFLSNWFLRIEYKLSPECLREIKTRGKKARRRQDFVPRVFSRKHEGKVFLIYSMCTSLQSNRGNKRDKDNKGVVGATRAVLVRRSVLLRPFRPRNRHGLCGPRGHTMNDRLMGASENATEMRKRRSEITLMQII